MARAGRGHGACWHERPARWIVEQGGIECSAFIHASRDQDLAGVQDGRCVSRTLRIQDNRGLRLSRDGSKRSENDDEQWQTEFFHRFMYQASGVETMTEAKIAARLHHANGFLAYSE